MFVRACFPFFDTRFAREDAAGDQRRAPLWLSVEPPPKFDFVGRLGRVAKWIPPLPYARCSAADLIKIDRSADRAVALRVDAIEAVADQHGHARLAVTLEAQASADRVRMTDLIESVASANISICHPERRGLSDSLGAAADVLCDLYARESARTAPEPRGDYQPDWVHAGRPFLIVVNSRREPVELPLAVEMPAPVPGFGGSIRFFPWRSDEGGAALPIWYLEAPRGGDAWRQPAEALEDLTAHYEELFVCATLEEKAGDDPAYARYLELHRKRLTGVLRVERRHGVELQAALRLLSDYDRSVFKPREADDLERAMIARINAQISDYIEPRQARSIFMTFNQTFSGGTNIVNFGEMTGNTITQTNTMFDESSAPDALKDQLKALRTSLVEAAKTLPEADARTLLKDYESFTETALREKPPKEVVKAQGNNLIDTVKSIAAFATPVATIVGAILKIVAG
ncbi:hypothetical protein FHS95_004045 [Sphingomonas naasensis]|uniref:Uncharacterized protein n=1 Tax=Sphingomonas naasensis TaxID=1344951 RepID=A0A4S1WG70_9SPHN|nr:hypothetical protein [Sphingomonas naasensis]NIJ22330.1 hypothetical protein [Sphingomonas naasensis]TGX40667.1 hypothetical protein E5A74_14300 [Sphingomonas naasensis]